MACLIHFYSYVVFHCIYVPPLLYPFICQWHLGCFYVLTIVSSAAMNIGVHVSFWIIILSDICPGVGLLDHMATLYLAGFLRHLHTVFHCGCFTFPPTVQKGFLLSTAFLPFVFCSLFNDGHSDHVSDFWFKGVPWEEAQSHKPPAQPNFQSPQFTLSMTRPEQNMSVL